MVVPAAAIASAAGAAAGGGIGLGSIASGIGSLVGAFGGIGGGSGSAKRFRNRQQDFLERSYYNQVQDRVIDLKRAGLNPMLAINGGMNSNAPSSAPNSENPSSAKQVDISKMLAASQLATDRLTRENLKAQNKNINVQNENIKQDTVKKAAETALTDSMGAKTVQDYRIGRAAEAAAKIDESIYNNSAGALYRLLEGKPASSVFRAGASAAKGASSYFKPKNTYKKGSPKHKQLQRN